MSILREVICVRENWLSYFMDSTELLIFEIAAVEVYDEIVNDIAENDSVTNFQEKRNLLYNELEKLFDSSNDDFVISVIGHSFKTGIYHIMNGLSTQGNLDIYKGKTGKRYKEFTDKALNSSLKLAEQLIIHETQFRIASSLIEVALQCADKVGKEQIKKQLEKLIHLIKFKENKALSVQKFEFLIPAINFLLEDKKYRNTELLIKIEELIDFSVKQGDTAKSVSAQFNAMRFSCIFPQAFSLKKTYYRKENDINYEKDTALQLAKTYEKLGDQRAKAGDSNNLQVAIRHYKESVKVLQEYGIKDELEKVKRKLDRNREVVNNMPNNNTLKYHKNLLDTISQEVQEQLNGYLVEFDKLDINAQINHLLSITPLVTKLTIKNFRTDSKQKNVFSEQFRVDIVNEHSQTVFTTDNEENKESYALFKYIQYILCTIGPFLNSIFEKEIHLNFSEYIGEIEPISRRAHLCSKAFELFFMGDVYSALYLLVPQVEYWFREEVYRRGGQTSNLNYFPVEQARTLTPIFETKELKEYLGDDIHWLFEEMMTKEPMNIRNKIAHGLEINDNGYCMYFVLSVLKLIKAYNKEDSCFVFKD